MTESPSNVAEGPTPDMPRGVGSPDEWDAVALTFAELVPAEESKRRGGPRNRGNAEWAQRGVKECSPLMLDALPALPCGRPVHSIRTGHCQGFFPRGVGKIPDGLQMH